MVFYAFGGGAYYIESQPINLYPLSQKGQRVGFIRLLISRLSGTSKTRVNLCFGIVDSAEDLLPVEDDPVGCEAAGGGEDFPDRAVGEPVPGVIPAAAHVTVNSIPDAEFPKAGEEGSERQTPGAIDNAESSADLAEGPVAVRAVCLEAALELFPVMEKEALAKAHPALLRRFF